VSDPASFFSPAELALSCDHHRAVARVRAARWLAEVSVPLAFVLLGVAERLVRPYPPAMWADRALTVAFALELAAVPHRSLLGGWEERIHDRHAHAAAAGARPELPPASWGRCVLVAGCSALLRVLCASAVLVAGLVLMRATPWWPLLAAAVAGGVLLVGGAVYPVVAAPLTDRAVPLRDVDLERRIGALATRAGLRPPTVLVSTAEAVLGEGAYVAGLGRARRLVLSARVLDGPASGVDAVVAHELSHLSLRHQRRAFLATGLVLVAQVVLLWLATALAPAELAPGDAQLLPVLVLVVLVSGAAGRLALAGYSRSQEREADASAVELLGGADAVLGHLRRVVVDAGADLQPTAWRRLLSSHPPPAERLAAAEALAGG
jgi:Zn-dependent protease with chaperone function